MKQKNQPKTIRKPRPILHMIIWGGLSGQILGVLYLVFLFAFVFDGGTFGSENMDLLTTLEMFVSPFVWYFAGIFGALPGLIMGLIDGAILRRMAAPGNPYTKGALRSRRTEILMTIFFITLILLALPSTMFFPPLLIAPLFIAATAATYAANRYLFRLQLYYRQQRILDEKKSHYKTKHRLADDAHDDMLLDEIYDLEQDSHKEQL